MELWGGRTKNPVSQEAASARFPPQTDGAPPSFRRVTIVSPGARGGRSCQPEGEEAPAPYKVVKLLLRILYHTRWFLSIRQFMGVIWEIGVLFGIIWDSPKTEMRQAADFRSDWFCRARHGTLCNTERAAGCDHALSSQCPGLEDGLGRSRYRLRRPRGRGLRACCATALAPAGTGAASLLCDGFGARGDGGCELVVSFCLIVTRFGDPLWKPVAVATWQIRNADVDFCIGCPQHPRRRQ
jgi:hypothetical protein